MKRRTLLTGLVCGGSLVIGGIIGVPVLVFALSPAKEEAQEAWRDLGKLADFPIGSVTAVELRWSNVEQRDMLPHGLFVWRRSVEQVVVYSRSCTDLGCPLTFDEGSHCFICPCHGGIFSKNGKRLAGPPDQPLYQYRVRVRDENIQVDVLSVPPVA